MHICLDLSRPAPDAEAVTLSWGTTRPADVADALSRFIESHGTTAQRGALAGLGLDWLEDLWDLAGEVAGPYWGVGTHPGDPSHVILAPAEWWEAMA